MLPPSPMPADAPPLWNLETLWLNCEPLLRPVATGLSIELLPEIDSSNSELMRRARAGRREATLLIAERQTAGRGRNGKTWHTDTSNANEKQALTFSLGLPYPVQDFSGLSLAVGCALAESLDPEAVLGLQLKWPNDVWVRLARADNDSTEPAWHKLAGILLETVLTAGQTPYLVVGIGLNIDTPTLPQMPLATSPSHSIPPIGLVDIKSQAVLLNRPQALHAIAPALIHALQEFAEHGFAAFQTRFQARDALNGHTVQFSSPSAPKDGVAVGVDARGALLVRTERGLERVNSQEVSVRMHG